MMTVPLFKLFRNFKMPVFAFLAFIIILGGCVSHSKNIAPLPPQEYKNLGRVTGRACGALVSPLAGTAYYFVPVKLNSRIYRAYENALSQAPGATALIDVTMEESWYWWVFGTTRCVTITGEAIK